MATNNSATYKTNYMFSIEWWWCNNSKRNNSRENQNVDSNIKYILVYPFNIHDIGIYVKCSSSCCQTFGTYCFAYKCYYNWWNKIPSLAS